MVGSRNYLPRLKVRSGRRRHLRRLTPFSRTSTSRTFQSGNVQQNFEQNENGESEYVNQNQENPDAENELLFDESIEEDQGFNPEHNNSLYEGSLVSKEESRKLIIEHVIKYGCTIMSKYNIGRKKYCERVA